jgi:hypothetical protein
MATTVHIPKALLEALDRRAKRLGTSRNQLIVRAIEKDLEGAAFTAEFLERLGDVDDADREAVDEMVAAIASRRTRKKAPKL